jgi:hypothetical protein
VTPFASFKIPNLLEAEKAIQKREFDLLRDLEEVKAEFRERQLAQQGQVSL